MVGIGFMVPDVNHTYSKLWKLENVIIESVSYRNQYRVYRLAPVVGLLSPGQYGAGNVWLAASSHSRYPILREAGWLATVVSLAHIGVVGTGDQAGGLWTDTGSQSRAGKRVRRCPL